MLFYKINATVDEKEVLPNNKNDAEYQSLANTLCIKSEEDYIFNQRRYLRTVMKRACDKIDVEIAKCYNKA